MLGQHVEARVQRGTELLFHDQCQRAGGRLGRISFALRHWRSVSIVIQRMCTWHPHCPKIRRKVHLPRNS